MFIHALFTSFFHHFALFSSRNSIFIHFFFKCDHFTSKPLQISHYIPSPNHHILSLTLISPSLPISIAWFLYIAIYCVNFKRKKKSFFDTVFCIFFRQFSQPFLVCDLINCLQRSNITQRVYLEH
jgi:hypothetical protein